MAMWPRREIVPPLPTPHKLNEAMFTGIIKVVGWFQRGWMAFWHMGAVQNVSSPEISNWSYNWLSH